MVKAWSWDLLECETAGSFSEPQPSPTTPHPKRKMQGSVQGSPSPHAPTSLSLKHHASATASLLLALVGHHLGIATFRVGGV